MSPSQAYLSVRVDAGNTNHHLWNNHGIWWIHYTLNSEDGRTRRVRRSLGTRHRLQAIERRDEVFARVDAAGEVLR